MRRWLFNIAAAGSLVILLGVAGLWVRDYGHLRYRLWGNGWFIMSSLRGRVAVFGCHWDGNARDAVIGSLISEAGKENESFDFGKMLIFSMSSGAPLARGYGVMLPNWFAVLLTAILPALWLYRRIRHRTKPGHCVACGYNLKCTIDAGRGECPECGKPIGAKA